MINFRMLVDVLRHSGFGPITCVFAAAFLICSTAVWLADPQTLTFGDGAWFSFEVVSTIGFGDVSAAGPVARVAAVVLSVLSIFYIALFNRRCRELLHDRNQGAPRGHARQLRRQPRATRRDDPRRARRILQASEGIPPHAIANRARANTALSACVAVFARVLVTFCCRKGTMERRLHALLMLNHWR